MFYLNPKTSSHPGGPNPIAQGWLYLAYDYRHLELTKIGITTRSLFERIRETTTNPWYALFCGFHVPDLEALDRIETYIGRALHTSFVKHLSSRESEWCCTSPSDALSLMVEILPNIMSIEPDEGEYDFTKTIYLPAVNPYAAELRSDDLHELIRFAAPAVYLDELRNGYRNWPERPNFVAEVDAMGSRTPLTITGPKILLERINYDIARRARY